jgi:cell division protein FtsB
MKVSQLKLLSGVLLGLFLFLQYRLWFESGGVIDMLHLKKQLAQQVQDNDKLKKRNEILVKQVQVFQANRDAVESRARQELGMIKKGETFYQVVE